MNEVIVMLVLTEIMLTDDVMASWFKDEKGKFILDTIMTQDAPVKALSVINRLLNKAIGEVIHTRVKGIK